MKTDFLYYGLFVSEKDKSELLDFLSRTKYIETILNSDKIFIDHLTVLFYRQLNEDGAFELKNYLENNIGNEFEVKISAIGQNDTALAFKVESNIKNLNKNPHITICTFNGGKPFDSSFINNWRPLEKIFNIKCRLKKIVPNNA